MQVVRGAGFELGSLDSKASAISICEGGGLGVMIPILHFAQKA